MATLLDGNLLIALAATDHVHHDAAERWRVDNVVPIATCPITQGRLLRQLVRSGLTGEQAVIALDRLLAALDHKFWADDIAYDPAVMGSVIGHRQVSDAYLAALARRHGGRLATFDAGLAATYPDVVDLVPT